MSDAPRFTLRPARLADAERIFALIRSHAEQLVPKPMGDVVASIDRFVVAEAGGETKKGRIRVRILRAE